MKALLVKIVFLFMFLSGILLWDLIDLEWSNTKILLVMHVFGSIPLTLFFILPFIKKHSKYYKTIKKRDSFDGKILLIPTLLIFLSGFYLFLFGNRGGDMIGSISFYLHLYGSFVFVALFMYHIKPKENSNITLTILSFIILFSPTLKAEKLTNFEIENSIKRYHSEDWTNSAKCKSCHSEIFNQWSNSNHKHMAGSNPYYMVLETLAGEVEGEEFRTWCMGCHNPSALTTGQTRTSHTMQGNFLGADIFENNAKTLQNELNEFDNFRLEEGVSCIACHRMTKADEKGNASYSLDLTNRKKYPFEDSSSTLAKWLGESYINSKPEVHKKSYSKEFYKKSNYCASCHNESHPTNNIKIVSTFNEWEKSPFNNPKDPSKHKTCIDCHMTNLKEGDFSPLKAQSTDGGKIKNDVKVHYFAGANHFLSGLKDKKNEEQTLQLLRTSAKLDIDIKNNILEIGVKNVGAGHHLPTGTADFREMWLDIEIFDSEKNLIFTTGKLKDDGDLDSDTRVFMKVFGDEDLKPVGLLFWKYKKLISDTRIPSGERRVESFELNKNLKYPLNIKAKLNFRIYPQWVTNAVKKMYPQLPNPPVVEIAKIEKIIDQN